ncbi:MAG: hypothetical protein D6805_10055 [Planctomycetota bacterium]|nr:MAG: hypothetical protein D6805_10055 [Planctomycetota bacterium]
MRVLKGFAFLFACAHLESKNWAKSKKNLFYFLDISNFRLIKKIRDFLFLRFLMPFGQVLISLEKLLGKSHIFVGKFSFSPLSP